MTVNFNNNYSYLTSFKSRESADVKPAVNNSTSQINDKTVNTDDFIKTDSTSKESKKSKYLKMAAALTGVVLLAVGIYKRKPISEGLSKMFGHEKPVKPEIKPEFKPEIKPEIKPEVKHSSTAAKLDDIPLVEAEEIGVFLPTELDVKAIRQRRLEKKNMPTIYIDESGNILNYGSKKGQQANRNSVDDEFSRIFDAKQRTNRTQRANSSSNFRNRVDDTIDDVTDYIILDDILSNGFRRGGAAVGGGTVADNIAKTTEELSFSGFGRVADDIAEHGSSFADRFTSSLDDVFDDIANSLDDMTGSLDDVFGGIFDAF